MNENIAQERVSGKNMYLNLYAARKHFVGSIKNADSRGDMGTKSKE